MNCSNYQDSYEILRICREEYEFFLNKLNVVGVALGHKIKNGFYTSKICIKVLVSKKFTTKDLFYKDLIPKMYKNIETDVVESGEINASALIGPVRPIIGGYSLGPFIKDKLKTTRGSIGCVVTDNENFYVLSNNHVLAYQNTIPLGTEILQPPIYDGGIYPRDSIGVLSKYIPLDIKKSYHDTENYVDCAIAKVWCSSMISSKIALIGTIAGVENPKLNQAVEKSGRTTEYTSGKITAIGATIDINFPDGKALFKNQIVTTKMTENGDSGSVLIDFFNEHAIGLFFANSATYSYYNPINEVLNRLSVQIFMGK